VPTIFVSTFKRAKPTALSADEEGACRLRRRQPPPGDNWHLDEVFVQINGRRQDLCRAVDQGGNVLDILVQSRRDA
jgi:putative transposase